MDKSFWTAAGILSEFYGVLICILEANFRAYRMIWLVSGIIFTAYGLLPFPFLKWAAAFAASAVQERNRFSRRMKGVTAYVG